MSEQEIKAYSNLMKIHQHLCKLQAQHPHDMVRFMLFNDWSGGFGYYVEGGFVELEGFNSFSELEKIINGN